MPATEETWYNQKLLHVIFGCSSLIMLIATIWMVAQDHERPWKNVQRDFRDIQRKQLNGRLRAEQKNQTEVVKQAELMLAAAQSELPDESLLNELKEAATLVGEYSFTNVDDNYEELKIQARNAESAMEKFEGGQVAIRNAIANVQSTAESGDEAVRTAASDALQKAQDSVAPLEEAVREAQQGAIKLRDRILSRFDNITKDAKYQMDTATGNKKLASARFDAVKAQQGLLYGKEEFEAAEAMQDKVDAQKQVVAETLAEQERTTANRNRIRDILTRVRADEAIAKKGLDDALAEQNRMNLAIDELKINYFSPTSLLGKKILELPIVDGFNGPLKIDNLWTDGLTMPNGSFGEVRRFDRCTTCHKGIDKTAPGSATIPAYEKRHEVVVQLQTPSDPPAPDATIEDVYGIVLADEGFVDRNDVTIEYVTANSKAALAVNVSDAACAGGLMEGDVIRYIGGDSVDTPRDALQFLLAPVEDWGTPVEVIVERGLPQPFTSHPRLDLYVGSLSPHKMSDIGCTVCHEGQGSGTSFNYASHTPDSLEQEDQWWKKYGWFSNHHWIYPMNPARFAESGCLKCHHEVVELGASEKFPETPAPKLLAGHNLIQAYGCYGCHEINGYKSKTERVGPDLRLEPNYFAAAAQLAHDSSFQQLPQADQELAHYLIQHPYDDGVRHDLLAVMAADAASDSPKLSAKAQKLTEVLGDIEIPGTLRKTGPSLRHVGTKVGKSFLYDWIREPKHFRPSTKMPQFFGMWDHIQEDEAALAMAQKFEPVEIMGIVTYLLDRSQPMLGSVDAPEGVAAPDAERGRLAFETRGCLACHQHSAFDDSIQGEIASAERPGVSRQMQGPDLSNLGDKLKLQDNPDSLEWLYTWLRNPQLYHPRTKMPNLYLEENTTKTGEKVDPAADIAAFLMASTDGWTPEDPQLTPDPEVVREVAYEYLKKAFFGEEAKKYLKEGIPEEIAKTLKGSEVELMNVGDSPGDMDKKLLNYIGAKTIGKYGCYGCHDIPGFEGAKPIGVALADWGRKDASKIAFEHIAEYISHGSHGSHSDHGDDHGGGHSDAHGDGENEEHIDEHFYTHRLEHHDRTGFIWQKLKEPRSYDYKKVLNKDYNEKLRMPMFPFTDVQREQVITFILGLVAEPPAEKFIYRPDDHQKAMIDGKKVLDKYNCAGCHVLETERWEIEYRPGEFEVPDPSAGDYPFTISSLASDALASSATPDRQRGNLTGVVHGMPTIYHPARSEDNGQPVILEYDSFEEEYYPVEEDSEYDPSAVKYSLTLWEPSAIDGKTMDVGAIMDVSASAIKKRYPANGGDLTLRLLPRVLEVERESNTAAKAAETWAWLAPPLHNEGTKVQPDWLQSFLLEPHPIRPAVFMRMPKFNMSPDEAKAVADYFVARDGADYELPDDQRLDQLEQAYAEKTDGASGDGIERLHAAMNIVTDKNYCVTCHQVGDYEPGGELRAKAPNLASVFERLRPDYVRKWVAKPSSVLPYTAMPVLIKYEGGVPQDLYHGTSTEQLDGVVDLLMNYDRYTAGRSSIKGMVKMDEKTAAKP